MGLSSINTVETLFFQMEAKRIATSCACVNVPPPVIYVSWVSFCRRNFLLQFCVPRVCYFQCTNGDSNPGCLDCEFRPLPLQLEEKEEMLGRCGCATTKIRHAMSLEMENGGGQSDYQAISDWVSEQASERASGREGRWAGERVSE